MLNNTGPSDVIDYMLDHHQITQDGDPAENSAFALFKSACIDNTANKVIGDIGDDDQLLPEACYDPATNDSELFTMFRLYIIDTTTTDGMDAAA